MYETIISYAPKTKNTILEIVNGESFEYEECGVKAILTPTTMAIINSPKPKVYLKNLRK